MVAEGNDKLLEEFFEKGTLPPEEISEGLRDAVRQMRIFPVLCESGLHNIGTDLLLNFILDDFPAPSRPRPVEGQIETEKTSSARLKDSEPAFRYSCLRPSPIRLPAVFPTSK